MPIEKQMLMTLPDWDVATQYGSYWVDKSRVILSDKGLLITTLKGYYANKEDMILALKNFDPLNFWGMGHGNEKQFAGQDNYVLLEKGVDEALMIGRVVHLTSCLTGVSGGLLESLADAGALACFGYFIEFILGVETPNFPITPDNAATESLMKPDVAIEYALADGKACVEAMEASDVVSGNEIEYWRQSGHPDADLLIYCLVHNRDGKVLYGVPQSRSRISAPMLSTLGVMSVWASVFGLGIVASGLPKEVKA